MTDQFEVQRFARDFARRLAKLERSQRRTAASPNTLNHAAIDGGELVVKDDQGQVKYHLGTDPVTGVTAPRFEPGPVPNTPEAPDLEAREGAVHVSLSGVDVDEQPAPEDLRLVEIHMSLDEHFEVSPGTMAGSTPNPVDGVSISKAAGVWWVRVVWVTLSGQRSEPSEAVSVDIVPPVDAQDIQDTLDAAQEALDEYRDEVAAPRFQALEEGLSENNDNLEDARTRLSAAEETLSPLPGRIDEAEQEVEQARDAAVAAEARATEANNRAMTRLANGNFENGLDYWDYQNVSLSSVAHSGVQAASLDHGGGHLFPASSMPVVPGQIWEISLYYQGDVTVAFQSVVDDTRTALESFDLDGGSAWADSGSLRLTVPDGVDLLSFTISGEDALVDDITLRDVTDVVRLEEAANANRQKAEDAIAKADLLELSLDGEGGLKDRLQSAESTLQDKADSSQLPELETRLSEAFGEGLDEVEAEATRKANEARDAAIKALREYVRDGDNLLYNGSFEQGWDGWDVQAGEIIEDSDAHSGDHVVSVGRPNANDYPRPNWITTEHGRVYLTEYWAKKLPGGTDPQELKIYYQVTRRDGTIVGGYANDSTGAQLRVFAEDMPVDEWVKVSGLVEITQQQAREFRIAPHVYRTGERFHVDDVRLYDITEAYNALQIAKDAAETAYLDRLVVRDEVVTPDTITQRLWADLAVINRLQAAEGWVGGVNLEDGAVTAEKIHATRELITKIMGAEWAYIAQQLIVDGSILTRDLEALSAAIQSLTVTQRADIAELWAEELWTALAVIEELQAEEAWITSAMISELTAEKVTVTENFVGRVAELLHLVVDRIDANALWADQTWQREAYFGSADGDYATRNDGRGLSIWRQVEGEQQLATRLGPGENALSFFDEDTGQLTGSLSQDGSAKLNETSVQSLAVAGRDLTHEPDHYQTGVPLLDSMPRGVWVAGPIDMAGVEEDRHRLGFLELTADVQAGRVYRLSTNNFLMRGTNEYRGRFRYEISQDGSRIPTVNSPELGSWIANNTTALNLQEGGRTVFVAEQTGVLRVLLCMETATASTTGINFNHTTAWAGNIQMWLEDLGTNKNTIYRRRFSASGGPDPDFLDDTPGVNTYRTEWVANWRAAYYNGGATRRVTGDGINYGFSLPQGTNPRLSHLGAWTSLAGFAGATSSTHTSEQGLTFQAATAGADIQTVQIELTGAGTLGNDTRFYADIQWAPDTTAPNQYLQSGARLMVSHRIDPGQTRLLDIPEPYWPLLQTGDFSAVGFASSDYSMERRNGWLAWGDQRPKIIVTYQK